MRRRAARQKGGALAQLVERLLCKQDVIGSNPLGSTIIFRFDRKAVFCFPVQSDVCFFGSFYIVQRDNQRCRLYPSVGAVIFGSNDDVVQVKYTNQLFFFHVKNKASFD